MIRSTLLVTYATLLPIVVHEVKAKDTNNNFYLADKRLTVKCPNARMGESGTINGKVYTKLGKDEITTSNVETTCTSEVTDMSHVFAHFGWIYFNDGIASLDTCQMTNLAFMFKGALAFNKDISKWTQAE